ncbi:MAG TPA: cyclodeaminase/cyclohydrolase family protein [Azonexus sp.]|nr:cyclodeaminase/cyclohydrolase family protein [Azonexus sp.]
MNLPPLEGLRPYLEALASRSPVPGGGVAAAVTIGQGLALLSMVCNLTIGKRQFSSVQSEVSSILERVTEMRAMVMSEAEADIHAFTALMAAYQMASDAPSLASKKKAAVARATRAAAEPPFRLMALVLEAQPFADRLAQIGNPNVLSDVLVGRHLLVAGYASSVENVEANLRNLSAGDPFIDKMKARMKALQA